MGAGLIYRSRKTNMPETYITIATPREDGDHDVHAGLIIQDDSPNYKTLMALLEPIRLLFDEDAEILERQDIPDVVTIEEK